MEKKLRITEEADKQEEYVEEANEGRTITLGSSLGNVEEERGYPNRTETDITVPTSVASGLVAYCDSSDSSDTED